MSVIFFLLDAKTRKVGRKVDRALRCTMLNVAPKAHYFWHRGPSRTGIRDCSIHLLIIATFFALISVSSRAAEVIPPKPTAYFNDYANIVSSEAAHRFNEQLAQFERDTSNQFVVAIFPTFPSSSSIQDFAQRTFQSWKVWQAGKNNGVVLFIFAKEHQMWIQTGYGLEGALPDATCFEIINNVIRPKFKTGDYEGGLNAGINAIIAATRGEYKGSGRTVGEQRTNTGVPSFLFFIIFVIVLIVISRMMRRLSGYGYSSRGGGPIFLPLGGGAGGWSSGGGGGGGGGFSSFVGGGGLGGGSGGGGAGGSW
jgi:uncharacterized protein